MKTNKIIIYFLDNIKVCLSKNSLLKMQLLKYFKKYNKFLEGKSRSSHLFL